MKIRLKDKVKVISGKDKGKIGEVVRVLPLERKVVVQGVNIVKRHVKPGVVNKEGGIVTFEKPIDVSNVIYFNEAENLVSRLGFTTDNGKKFRVVKKNNSILGK
ncbi:50S ribosomal protein L24 [bacterium]|jgi:large subunit ribosomal protein L24|nr:50S ribosomal protein L24 [bacterium]NBO35970.1 50S ribosomal protein L24 [bacterium]